MMRLSSLTKTVLWGAAGGGLVAWMWARGRDDDAEDMEATMAGPYPEAPPSATEPVRPSGGSTAQTVPSGASGNMPEAGSARDRYILSKVAAGDYLVDWVPVQTNAGGHTGTFWVTGDALRIDGLRVNASATLQQQIADLVGARLPTAKLFDLAYAQAPIRISPMPRSITTSTAAMIDQSAKIDRAIAAAAGSLQAARDKLVGGIGKTWLMDKHWESSPSAVNYGWHFQGSTFGGQSWSQTETGITDPSSGRPLRMIQGRGFAHDRMHTDYSQDVFLVASKGIVDGREIGLDEALTRPDLAPLVSHQGALRILRQPGVTVASPAVV